MQIVLESVSKRYLRGEAAVDALNHVTLGVPPGDFVAVVGPSGAGKSTLLSLVGGLDYADAGRTFADGDDLGEMDSSALADYRRRRVGFVFQSFRLMPALTVQENVMLPLVPMPLADAEKLSRATHAMEVANIIHRADHLPGEMSGGEQQRAAIARAIVNQPELVIADEPTGELDSENAQLILSLLSDLNARDGRTVLLATHDRDVAAVARRVIVMRDGHVVGDNRRGE